MRAELESLADRLEPLSQLPGCLASAHFHAWRGAVLLALGRAAEAVEPLERALMMDPELPGAQLDLAQAFAAEGDRASASSMLQQVGLRQDLPPQLRSAIDLQLAALAGRLDLAMPVAGQGWLTRAYVTSLLGADSNLNNAPAASEITLTLPQGNVTLPLDPASRPRDGAATLNSLNWQGLRQQGRALVVLQGELRARHTGDRTTGFEQADVAGAWLQDPSAPGQWVVRGAASHLRFGGATLLNSRRLTLQRQEAPPAFASACRPTGSVELEHKRFPESLGLNGMYAGVAAGFFCRSGEPGDPSYMNMELRLGEDHPSRDDRVGGVYRRAEVRLQGERPFADKGRISMQWSSAYQADSQPYSPLLGNVPRRALRHALQLEATWRLGDRLSLVGLGDAAWQRSNIGAFASRQRSVYLGLRWELM